MVKKENLSAHELQKDSSNEESKMNVEHAATADATTPTSLPELPTGKIRTSYTKLPNEETVDEIEAYLRRTYDMKLNVVLGKVEFRRKGETIFQEMDQYHINSIARDIKSSENLIVKPAQIKEVLESDFVKKYDPIKSYFEGLLEWDGTTDYIQMLADTVEPANKGMWEKYLKKWLVAMVAGCIDDKVTNQTVLIFIGKQGIGKSTWINKLVPDELRRYYYEGSMRTATKDAVIQLSENFLINLDEMDNMIKGDSNAMKQLITQGHISVRKPYAQYTVSIPRRASFTGSLNHKAFLTDISGNRRYLCFEVEGFNNASLIDMRLVYAQAYELYKQGFTFWLKKEDVEEISSYNKEFEQMSMEEEALILSYRKAESEEDDKIYMSSTDIVRHLAPSYKLQVNSSSVQHMGRALSKHQFKRIKKGGRYVYELVKIKKLE